MRRQHSNQAKGKEPESHEHKHEHEHGDDHSHSHSILGALSHTHAPGEEGHGHGAEQIVEALQSSGDKGSRITLIGLGANVCLTATKGAAGWYMNSASLLADAGHGLSDLVGDFVTLFCWKLSRKPPSERYPYGFGKFEVLGTVTVSLLLTGGALGIGFHSWSLLTDALAQTATTLPAGTLHDVVAGVVEAAHSVPVVASEHGHVHSHAHSLDPNAAWFAALGVVAKEMLYRATKRVAEEEHSPVLNANALHHRSDAYSSLVALIAILGSWWFPHLPLDPIGGLVVSVLIVRQSWSILLGAFHQLTDGSVSPKTRKALAEALSPLLSAPALPASSSPLTPPSAEQLLAIRDLRAKRAGALMFVDLTVEVPRTLSVAQTSTLEGKIARTLKDARKEVAEVQVRFRPAAENR
ncbi:Mitochondrial metal transporter 2 [Sparassis crispa]|uniref:Mitochondrial metal transporter 2 n=1 Tax=Sparassis crispa TaxID=139825 RepID=A0A401GHB1_9APHY|nr:Mitochondrial metal transporter 2 [Sparassis crispa]GBE81570.1 Mitochondrial metal transporter 2 [Sparassis crispa]